jgi:hypothetical protein
LNPEDLSSVVSVSCSEAWYLIILLATVIIKLVVTTAPSVLEVYAIEASIVYSPAIVGLVVVYVESSSPSNLYLYDIDPFPVFPLTLGS